MNALPPVVERPRPAWMLAGKIVQRSADQDQATIRPKMHDPRILKHRIVRAPVSLRGRIQPLLFMPRTIETLVELTALPKESVTAAVREMVHRREVQRVGTAHLPSPTTRAKIKAVGLYQVVGAPVFPLTMTGGAA